KSVEEDALEQLDSALELATILNDILKEEALDVELSEDLVSEKLSKTQTQLKETLINDPGKALKDLQKIVRSDSPLFDDIVLQLERYNRLTKNLQKGLVDYFDSDTEFTKIANTVIFIINSLEDADLK
ncbi:MAG TPA: hypothetical protein PKC40_07340, partial [Saprospiraceae bacterium]|nr:hypothetical protein [Saprospiraceae bacterium]